MWVFFANAYWVQSSCSNHIRTDTDFCLWWSITDKLVFCTLTVAAVTATTRCIMCSLGKRSYDWRLWKVKDNEAKVPQRTRHTPTQTNKASSPLAVESVTKIMGKHQPKSGPLQKATLARIILFITRLILMERVQSGMLNGKTRRKNWVIRVRVVCIITSQTDGHHTHHQHTSHQQHQFMHGLCYISSHRLKRHFWPLSFPSDVFFFLRWPGKSNHA